jgi:hypothetical protein
MSVSERSTAPDHRNTWIWFQNHFAIVKHRSR